MPNIGEIAILAFDNSRPATIETLKQQGWVACEGQSVARVGGPNGLPRLFQVLGTAWGSDDPNAFNVPDLRGEFLRGWTHGKAADPDAKDRAAVSEGGATGNKVGTAQGHAFAQHNHGFQGGTPVPMLTPSDDMCATHPEARVDRGSGEMWQGGSETRPRNVCVMFCIFTGHAPLPPQVKFFAT